MATHNKITEMIGVLCIVYNRYLGEAEAKVLEFEWEKEFRSLSDNDFEAACRQHMRQSRFFPSIAHILEAHQTSRIAQPTQTFALPYPEMTDEERIAAANRHLPQILADLSRHNARKLQ